MIVTSIDVLDYINQKLSKYRGSDFIAKTPFTCKLLTNIPQKLDLQKTLGGFFVLAGLTDIVACREIGLALNIIASSVSPNLNKRETQ